MDSSLNQLGPFTLHKAIGTVNHVVTYIATDTRQHQDCLIYLLDPPIQSAPKLADQFLQGARQAAQIRHEHILAIRDFGQIDGYTYAATATLRGQPLLHTLRQRRRPLADQETNALIQQIASGLEHAAAQGCLHQALTPAVLWLNEDGAVQISGFGVLTAASPAPTVTPFTAPEQLTDDGSVHAQADVYSLCALAYWLLLQQPPFTANEPALLREQILHQPPTAPEAIRADLPRSLRAVLNFGLAKEPHARYASPAELARVLQHALDSSAPTQSSTPLPSVDQLARWSQGIHTVARLRWSRNLVMISALVMVMLLTGILFRNQAVDGARIIPVASVTRLPAATTAPIVQPRAQHASAAEPTSPPASTDQDAVVTSNLLVTAPIAQPTLVPNAVAVAIQPSPTSEPKIGQLVQALVNDLGPLIDLSALRVTEPAQSPDVQPVATNLAAPLPPVAPPLPMAQSEPTQTLRLIPASAITLTTVISAADSSPAGAVISDTKRVATTTTQVNIHLPLVVRNIYIEGTVNQDANLRAGPSLDFPVMATEASGARIVLVACNEDCSWLQLNNGQWIAGFLVSDIADPLNTLPLGVVN